LRFTFLGESISAWLQTGQMLKRFGSLLSLNKIVAGDIQPIEILARLRFKDRDEVIRIAEWQRLNDDSVSDRKDGAVGTDTKRERQNRYDRKARILSQHAKGEAKIMKKFLHHCSLDHFRLLIAESLKGRSLRI